MTDAEGEVPGSTAGLARLAGVSLEDCTTALDAFRAPDEHSRSAAENGRRIVDIDGGWRLINHQAYLQRANEGERRRKDRDRKRAARSKRAPD